MIATSLQPPFSGGLQYFSRKNFNRPDRKTKQRAAGGVGSDLVVEDIDCSLLRGLHVSRLMDQASILSWTVHGGIT